MAKGFLHNTLNTPSTKIVCQSCHKSKSIITELHISNYFYYFTLKKIVLILQCKNIKKLYLWLLNIFMCNFCLFQERERKRFILCIWIIFCISVCSMDFWLCKNITKNPLSIQEYWQDTKSKTKTQQDSYYSIAEHIPC